MKYRLLILDIDGTLANSSKEVSERNRTTLLRLQEGGVKLVLASGRPTYGIMPIVEKLNMKSYGGYILPYNGGEVIEVRKNERLFSNVLPDSVLPILYETACRHNLPILSYDGEYVITELAGDGFVAKEALLNRMKVKEVSRFLEAVPRPVPKCLIVGEPERLIPVESELRMLLQGQINVFRSEPYFLELVPQGVDKGLSLAILMDRIGVKREAVVAMGDGYNDLTMIQFAGYGVAMGNAQEPVKLAAKEVTLTNDQDGVAVAVERLFPFLARK